MGFQTKLTCSYPWIMSWLSTPSSASLLCVCVSITSLGNCIAETYGHLSESHCYIRHLLCYLTTRRALTRSHANCRTYTCHSTVSPGQPSTNWHDIQVSAATLSRVFRNYLQNQMCEISVQITKLWNKQITKGKRDWGHDKLHMMEHRNLAVCDNLSKEQVRAGGHRKQNGLKSENSSGYASCCICPECHRVRAQRHCLEIWGKAQRSRIPTSSHGCLTETRL